MNLWAFIIAAVGPVTARVLASLGLSLVSMTGLAVSLGALKDHMLGNVGSLPADGVQLAGLFGIWEALGLCLGSLTFVVAWTSTGGFVRWARA